MAVNIGVNIQRSANRIAQAVRESAVGGAYPDLLIDVDDAYFRANGGSKAFSEVVTHSRSGNATMVDSDGLIKWAPHNLLTYSEAFDEADWTKARSVLTADNYGTITGFKVAQASGQTTACTVQQQGITADGYYTFSVVAKAGDNRSFIRLNDFNVPTSNTRASYFNVTTGATGTVDPGHVANITSLGGGYYLCSISFEMRSGSNNIGWFVCEVDNSLTVTDDGGFIYVYAPRLYRSDLGGMVDNPDRGDSYVPTTSSAVYLPRRGHHVYNGSAWVNEGLLHESEARVNLVTESIPATENSYSAVNSTLTKDSTTSPDGEQTASKFLENSLTGNKYFNNGSAISFTSGTVYVTSIFAKAGTQEFIQLTFPSAAFGTNQYANFDLSNGTLGSVGVDVLQANIQDMGNGWYRCSMSATATVSTSTTAGAVLINSATAARVSSYTGASLDIYVYGFQIEAAPTPSSYIPTAGATVTRAAETLTIPSANLPWPTPQVIGDELVTNGTFDTDSDWSKGTGWTISGGVASSSGSNNLSTISQPISFQIGKVYAVSYTVSNYISGVISSRFSGGGQLFGQQATGNGVYQDILSPTVAFTNFDIMALGGSGAIADIDNISVREINPLSVSIQMDGRMTYAEDQTPAIVYPHRWQLSSTNKIYPYIDTRSAAPNLGGRIYFLQEENNVTDATTTVGGYLSPGILVPFNIASRHGSTFLNGATDGVALTADTTPTALPDLSATDLNLGYDMMGTIKTFRIWDKDLGDTGIEEATAPSLEPSLELVFDGSESSFVVLDWEQ